MDFATAASRLLAAHAGWRDRDLVATPRGLRAEAISLALRAYRVTLVRTLCTRLQLTSSGEDVTADAPSDDGSGAGSGAAGAASTSATSSAHNSAVAHDDAWYVDRKGSELLLLATAPAGLSREQLLAQAVCEVLGVDAPTSLAPLLAVDASQAAATLARLRVPPPPHWATACMRSPRRLHSSQVPPPPQWAAASAVGSAGTPCTTEDEALLQLRPLRAYFAGEVVCISASQLGISAGGDEADGYVYAEVDVAVPAATAPQADGRGGGGFFDSGGGALSRMPPGMPPGMPSGPMVALRVGGQRARMQCLSLQVHSFRSIRRERAEASGTTAVGVAVGGRAPGADGAMPGVMPGSSTGARPGVPTGGPSSAELPTACMCSPRRLHSPQVCRLEAPPPLSSWRLSRRCCGARACRWALRPRSCSRRTSRSRRRSARAAPTSTSKRSRRRVVASSSRRWSASSRARCAMTRRVDTLHACAHHGALPPTGVHDAARGHPARRVRPPPLRHVRQAGRRTMPLLPHRGHWADDAHALVRRRRHRCGGLSTDEGWEHTIFRRHGKLGVDYC